MDAITCEIRRQESEVERVNTCLMVLRMVGEVKGLCSVFSHAYGAKPEVELTPEANYDVLEIVSEVLGTLHLRVAKKDFDKYTGKVQYIIEAPALTIKVGGGAPKRCEVVCEDVVENIPATTRTVKKYRLVDPTCLEG